MTEYTEKSVDEISMDEFEEEHKVDVGNAMFTNIALGQWSIFRNRRRWDYTHPKVFDFQ